MSINLPPLYAVTAFKRLLTESGRLRATNVFSFYSEPFPKG